MGTFFVGTDGKETILLESEKWKEGDFSLLPYVDPPEVREQLKTGTWTVVLYHHDCPKCKEVIKDLALKGEPNVVCVEFPLYGGQTNLPEGHISARLNQEKKVCGNFSDNEIAIFVGIITRKNSLKSKFVMSRIQTFYRVFLYF